MRTSTVRSSSILIIMIILLTGRTYLLAYIHKPKDGLTLPELNGKLVENAVSALNELCPRLQHFILQTGGKVCAELMSTFCSISHLYFSSMALSMPIKSRYLQYLGRSRILVSKSPKLLRKYSIIGSSTSCRSLLRVDPGGGRKSVLIALLDMHPPDPRP